MSLETPTTQNITANIVAQIEASIGQTVPLMPKAFIRVLAKALAGVYILLYKYTGFNFLQMFVSTASNDLTGVNGRMIAPLTEWGRLVGVGDPIPATQAELSVAVTVETLGGTLPAGSQLINSGSGVTYLTLVTVNLDLPTVSVTVRASADQSGGNGSGTIGNMQGGELLAFASPLANVARDTVVNSQVVTGVDGETVEQYRQRVVDRFQKTPQGGSYADYEQWAEQTPGVTAAYPYTSACPGMVDVYLQTESGMPTQAQLEQALAIIDSNRPANGAARTFPVTISSIDVEVTGLEVPNEAEVQIQIQEALAAYFAGRAPFISGLTILPRRDRITESSVAGVVEDVVTAADGIFELVNLSINSTEFGFYSLGIGEVCEVGAVSFA